MAKEILMEFQNGKVTLSVNGVKGQSCTDLTKQLEEALGIVQKREFTPEYKEREVKQVHRVNQ